MNDATVITRIYQSEQARNPESYVRYGMLARLEKALRLYRTIWELRKQDMELNERYISFKILNHNTQ